MNAPESHEPTPPLRGERRKQYRTGPARAHPLRVTLALEGERKLDGAFVDLSVRGVAARFHLAHDPALKPDDVVELTVSSATRESEVRTPCRTVYSRQDGESHLRYGFEFINVGDLFAQLDAFYARHFNRRASVRVLPELDRRVPVALSWGASDAQGTLHDLSRTGLGLSISLEAASRLGKTKMVAVSLQLPGQAARIHGQAALRHRKNIASKVLLGLAFDLDSPAGMRRFQYQIQEYIERREKEIASWEAAWS